MPIYVIEVAIVCDDIMEDGFTALSAIIHSLGMDPERDNITMEHGTDDSGIPVLLATLSVSDHAEEKEPNDVH